MYNVTVPLMVSAVYRSDLEALATEIKKFDAKRVLLALEPFKTQEKRQKELENLKRYTAFFKEKGFEVGAWFWVFWHERQEDGFTKLRSVSGNDCEIFMCPSDKEYRSFLGEEIKKVAECGVDLILFDDDFRFAYLSDGICCACENHLAEISNRLGETVTEELLEQKLLYGGENKYRDAFLNVNEYFMELFAKEMRQALDCVNPNIRMGRCCCMSSWDIDGADPVKIGKILAGNTKPFVRLVGAPYWAVEKSYGCRVQDVIEFERMAKSWTVAEDFEIVAEVDAYPRPRFTCPSSFLEGFDTAIRADGSFSGIMKYGMDYCSSANYEKGYALRHQRNKPLYKAIEDNFKGEALGIRLYEAPLKYAKTEIPKAIEGSHKVMGGMFSMAARMLSANAIPTTYYGDGICGMVFGENARHLPERAFENGLILDYTAAKILTEKGIDVGIKVFGDEVICNTEHFISQDEYANVLEAHGYKTELKDGVQIDSEFLKDNEKIPASYYYQNNDGQRFFVFLFETYYVPDFVWRNYTRGKQIAFAVKLLSGKKLPAVCHNNPDLYMMCKQDGKKLSVGLWNFCADDITEPFIELSKEYKTAEFIGCSGSINGDKIVLSNIAPYGFAGMVLE